MAGFTNIKECGFETLIVNWLVEQNGYEEGTNADYNKEYAIDENRLFRFLCVFRNVGGAAAELIKRLGGVRYLFVEVGGIDR